MKVKVFDSIQSTCFIIHLHNMLLLIHLFIDRRAWIHTSLWSNTETLLSSVISLKPFPHVTVKRFISLFHTHLLPFYTNNKIKYFTCQAMPQLNSTILMSSTSFPNILFLQHWLCLFDCLPHALLQCFSAFSYASLIDWNSFPPSLPW
jgi:hypothetical protein